MTPEGWDDQIPEAVLEGMRSMRSIYLAMLAVGFTNFEAATIIGSIINAGLERPGGNGSE